LVQPDHVLKARTRAATATWRYQPLNERPSTWLCRDRLQLAVVVLDPPSDLGQRWTPSSRWAHRPRVAIRPAASSPGGCCRHRGRFRGWPAETRIARKWPVMRQWGCRWARCPAARSPGRSCPCRECS
jgi:hypothetical protein